MGYLDDHLLPGEHVVHRARIHWVVFGWPIVFISLGVTLALYLYATFSADRYWFAGLALVVVGMLLSIGPFLRYISADFAITDKRVLAKYGLVRRQSLETLLTKVEAIGVDQDMTGRVLGYGTVTITGTGGTREALPMIAQPLEFRRRVQAQIVVLEERARSMREAPIIAPAAREERECPHCAELILLKAKVCKHCGLDVSMV